MDNSLTIAILDNEKASLLHLKELIITTKIARLVTIYDNPKKFVREFSALNFDLLILDIGLPGMNSKDVIRKVGEKKCIIHTSTKHKYEEAIECQPIDILIKQAKREHFTNALEKASKIISLERKNRDFQLFNIAEGKGKLLLSRHEILYVTSDDIDYRNKIIFLKDGTKYTLMNQTVEKLLKFSSSLIQVNRSEAIALDAVKSIAYDLITLKIMNEKNQYRQVMLSRLYHKNIKMALQNPS